MDFNKDITCPTCKSKEIEVKAGSAGSKGNVELTCVCKSCGNAFNIPYKK